MLGGLLGSKFSNKCKHSVKCINSRLVVITKKKQATVRFLKKDVADLISRGLDSNAFGRIDALFVEINHARCYDMIEKYCESILNLLPSMQKQRECPEDATEAVSTLIFAAARFSDLPELCDLRRAFLERFGSSIESFVNSEFVENMQKKSFSVDKKLQLMQDIAQEFSVSWDFKTFRQKLSNSEPASDESRKGAPVRNGNHEPPSKMLSGGNGAVNNVSSKILPKERYEPTPKPITQKQEIQPGLKDIHVISSMKGGRSHDPSFKTRMAFADEPENIEPPSRPTVHPYSKLNAKIVESDKHKDKQVGDAVSHKQQPPSAQQVGLMKSQDNKPVYSVPPYTKTKVASDAARAVDHTQDNSPFKRLSRDEDPLDPSGHERQPVRQLNYGQDRVMNKVPPPYVKPSINQVNADQDGGSPAHDIKDVKSSDRQIPRSVRSRRTKKPVLDEIDGSIDDRKQLSPPPDLRTRQSGREHAAATYYDDKYGDPFPNGSMAGEVADDAIDHQRKSTRTPTERIRQVGKHRATAYDDDYYGEGKMTGEIGDAIDYGKLMSRAPKYQGRQGHRSSTVTQDEDHHGERKTSNPKSLDADQEDNAIYFGKLLHPTPSGQRREGGRRAANHDGYRDEEERAMDRLLMHYSKKGMPENTSTGTRGSASGHAFNEGAPYHRQEGKTAKPLLHERVASLPPQPISPREVRAPTRATSMQPRAHPRMPEYEEVAARMAALRAKP